ncbi:MAG: hypothetical protein PUE01_03390, partial [Clostridiaceae bacterium]|nr:hypothetical protein [Clostridiaceae bacterium]
PIFLHKLHSSQNKNIVPNLQNGCSTRGNKIFIARTTFDNTLAEYFIKKKLTVGKSNLFKAIGGKLTSYTYYV